MNKTRNAIFWSFLTVLGFISDAQAISLRFNFKVYSSGPSVYACNAGVRHKSASSAVCYIDGTTTSCTPGNTTSDHCVCSGGASDDALKDYVKVAAVDWKDKKASGDSTSETGLIQVIKNASNGDGWTSALTDDATVWGKRIKELSFNLGSELYGSEYFVDICYRGSQIEYYADGLNLTSGLLSQVSATDFLATGANSDGTQTGLSIPASVDGKSYSELAALKVKAFYVCDMQGEGTYKYGHNGSTASSGTYNTVLNEAVFTMDANGYPTSGGDLHGTNGSFQSITSNGLDLINETIANSTHAPRFCKVRYVFTETNQNASTPFLRKWQRHGAEVSTYTKIEEVASN